MLVLCKLVSGTFWSVFWLGDIVSLLGGGRGAFPSGLEPDGPDVLFPVPSVSCCIMCIISSICSFRKAILVTFSFTRERPLVDISLAQDLVIMGSRCDGNLDYFLWEIFSLYNLGKNKRMGWERDGVHLKILTKWKHKQTLSLGSCLLKMHLSFFKYWLGPLSGFYHGEFYSDAELM